MASGKITTGIHARNKDGYQPRVSVFAPLTGMTGAYAIAPITPEDAPIDAITTKGYVQNKFDAKANIGLDNSPYTTNRILEIPQDIKLELNNGKLTLKAGSKVYVPNGAGKFDEITTTKDYSMSGAIRGNNTKAFIAYRNNAISSRPVSQSVS